MRRLLLAAALVLGGAFSMSTAPAEAYCMEPLPTFVEGQPDPDLRDSECMQCPEKTPIGKDVHCIE